MKWGENENILGIRKFGAFRVNRNNLETLFIHGLSSRYNTFTLEHEL